MPSTARRRRSAREDEESEDERPQNTQRKRQARRSDDSDEEEEEDEEGDTAMGGDADGDSQEQLVKKLVRYALACEYQRIPIRRAGISEKVIGKQRGRFKKTFDAAQLQLQTKFGMEMVELPVREKVTLKEKRAAEKKAKGTGSSSSSAAYILTSILPKDYRTTDIIPPSKVGNPAEEAAYTGFYTFVVSIIALSPQNMISNNMLRRHLSRVYAEEVMPLDKTENILAKMIKQGYITKTIERTEADEIIEYRVGPRGKIEVGNKGVQGLVNEVYGNSGPEDLARRIRRSLGVEIAADVVDEDDGEEAQPEGESEVAEAGPSRRSGRR